MSTHHDCKHGKAFWQDCAECSSEEKQRDKTSRRRAIENALRSIDALPSAREIILDNYDQAVAEARQEGHNACADKVLSHLASIKAASA